MKRTAKHTPGPWVVKAGRNIETPSGTFYLMYGKDRHGNPLFRDFVELDHNAHLIAAAPAMYEALCVIANAGQRGPLAIADFYTLTQYAKQALAQADGRT